MPIYEYECVLCQNRFDMFTNTNNRDNVTCPHCHTKNVKRLVSNLGFIKHPDQAHSSVSCCETKSSCETKGSCCPSKKNK